MLLKLDRYISNQEESLGILYTKGGFLGIIDQFECYVLEDEPRNQKVYSETRISAGIYEVTLRTVGRIHSNYLRKFGSGFHKGTLWLRNVPNFQYILIHIGNDDGDTAGCLLLGTNFTHKGGRYRLTDSTGAYKKVYAKVRDALLSGEKVYIKITDYDLGDYRTKWFWVHQQRYKMAFIGAFLLIAVIAYFYILQDDKYKKQLLDFQKSIEKQISH